MSEKIVEISEESLMWIDERYNRLREENIRLHNIIKEVREKIYKHKDYKNEGLLVEETLDILEILDKENK